METLQIIKDAKLEMFVASGEGLGAVLLAIVALVFVWRMKSSEAFLRGLSEIAKTKLRK